MNDEILTVTCSCGNPMKVRVSSIGKKVRCPQCQAITTIARPDLIDPAPETPETPASDSAPAAAPARDPAPAPESKTAQSKKQRAKATKPKSPPAKPKPASSKADEPKTAAAEPEPKPQPKAAERKKPKRKPAEPKDPVSIPEVVISDPPEAAPDFSALTIGEEDSPTTPNVVPVIPDIQTDVSTPVSSARDTTPEIKLDESPRVKKGASTKSKPQTPDSDPLPATDEIAPQDRVSEGTIGNARGGSDSIASPRTYPSLELIGKLYKVLGVLWFVLTGAASLIPLALLTQGGNLLVVLPSVLGGLCIAVLGAVTLFAASEMIRVVLDIQDNTHRSSLR